jgi:hypothetical protein
MDAPEVATPLHDTGKQTYVQPFITDTNYHGYHSKPPEPLPPVARRRPKILYIIAALLVLLVLGAIIGGAVGGVLGSKSK